MFVTTSMLMTHNFMLTFHQMILRQQPTGYPAVLRMCKYGWRRRAYFQRRGTRGYSVCNTKRPCSVAASYSRRHLWSQRHHFIQLMRTSCSSRHHFVDDCTNKSYLPDCLRPATSHSTRDLLSCLETVTHWYMA